MVRSSGEQRTMIQLTLDQDCSRKLAIAHYGDVTAVCRLSEK